MIKKPVFQLFVSGFDHRIGEFDIVLGDQELNGRR